MKKLLPFIFTALALLSSCTSVKPDVQADRTALNEEESVQPVYKGLKRKVAIARFTNESQYAKGAFFDKDNDPLGKQALDILSTKLAASGKFILLERADADKIDSEKALTDAQAAEKIGADYLIIGSITEFGRKNIGETDLFSRTKRQIVQAGVSLRLVDVSTGQIIYSEEGKGQAETESSTILGIGGTAGFDATLSDKAISAAISKLVENVINNCMDRPWKSVFLSADSDGIFIAGGIKQGLLPGKKLSVIEKGKTVKNPQTGMPITLPGKKAAEVKVISCGGTTVTDEYSIVEITEGSIDYSNISKYEITEK